MSQDITRPNPRIQDDKISTGKQLADFATELLDTEIQQATSLIFGLQQKYGRRLSTPANLEALRDEALTRLAEIGILATFDPTPCFYGKPPVLEFIGKVGISGPSEFDHEKKGYEVRKATARGEDYLGQRERANKRTIKDD